MGISVERDLREGQAVWTRFRLPKLSATRLKRSLKTEVVIVGAGISGAMIAQSLTAMGIKPVILERRRNALLGSTAASTALLQFELDTPLTKLSAAIGVKRAEKVWIASRNAVNELRTRTHRLGIDAHFCSRPSLYLAGNVLDSKGLEHEVRQRQRIGLASEYLNRKDLRHHFGIDRAAALLNHGNAEANPVELAAGYLRNAIRNGARLHAPHTLADIETGRQGCTLYLEDGLEIGARKVIFCTGYELAKIVPKAGTKVFSTWAIATRPQPQSLWPQKALVWEASEPYLYARSTSDGRVICGGEDEEFADEGKRNALLPKKTERIERKLKRLFPNIDERAVMAWTGSFGGSAHGMPTIGRLPKHPHCYAVMGYGGNGITFSMLATGLITGLIKGRSLPESKLFAF